MSALGRLFQHCLMFVVRAVALYIYIYICRERERDIQNKLEHYISFGIFCVQVNFITLPKLSQLSCCDVIHGRLISILNETKWYKMKSHLNTWLLMEQQSFLNANRSLQRAPLKMKIQKNIVDRKSISVKLFILI